MPSIEKTGNAPDSLVVGQERQSLPRIGNSTGILSAQTPFTDTIQPHLEAGVLQHESSNCFVCCCSAIKSFFSRICAWICSLFSSKEEKTNEENNTINNINQASIVQLQVEQTEKENSSSKSIESFADQAKQQDTQLTLPKEKINTKPNSKVEEQRKAPETGTGGIKKQNSKKTKKKPEQSTANKVKQQDVQKTPLIDAPRDNEDPADVFATKEDVRLVIGLFSIDLFELELDVQECYNKLELEILKSEEVTYCCLASLTRLKIEIIPIIELLEKLEQRPISKEQLKIAREKMSAKIKEISDNLKQPFSIHRANEIRDSVEKFCAGKFMVFPDPSKSLRGLKVEIALKLFDLINSIRKNMRLDPLSTLPEHMSEIEIDGLKITKCFFSVEILKKDIPKRYKNRIEGRDDAIRYLLDIQKLSTVLDAFRVATTSKEASYKKLSQVRTLHQQIRDHLERPLPTIGEAERDQARAMINMLDIIPFQWTIPWAEYLAANATAPKWPLYRLVNDIRTESGLEPIT